jgi:ABC-type phosphate transport system substrate-binding protein
MASRWARRVAAAGACAGALLLTATSAEAKKVTTQCSGSNIGGSGATAQSGAQSNWDATFNTSGNKSACNGTQGTKAKPAVSYVSSGSLAGVESWGVETLGEPNFGAANAFVGTDSGPTSAQLAEVESHEIVAEPGQILTIPVAQQALAVIVHLPEGCTATSTAAPGRLVLNSTTLAAIFEGEISKWNEITDGGDQVKCEGEALKRHAARPATKVIEFRRILAAAAEAFWRDQVAKKIIEIIKKFEKPWTPPEWPNEGPHPPIHVWQTEISSTVAATPSSIGFVPLAEARGNGSFASPGGGPGKETFWVEVQNSEKKGKATYSDPSTNGPVATAAASNCAKTVFTNGEGLKFPPPSVKDTWAEVVPATSSKTYPLCELTYDLASTHYGNLPGTSSGEAQSVKDFLGFALSKKAGGGQAALTTEDLAPVPKAVLTEAQTGAAMIGN